MLKNSAFLCFQGRLVAMVEAQFDAEEAVILQFCLPVAPDFVHFVISLLGKEDGSAGVLAVKASLHAPEGEPAVSVVFNGQAGRFDEVEVVAIPQIGFDDPPVADQGACALACHGGAAASSRRSLARLQAARASTNDASTRRRPRNRVCRCPP